MTDWRTSLAAVSADHDAGSWAITRRAAPALAQAAIAGPAVLRAAIDQLLAGQPSMAAPRNLANTAAWAVEQDADPAAAIQSFIARGKASMPALARQTTTLLGPAHRAVTLSASAAVERALLAWRGPVLVLESRPRGEGRALAGRLAAAGLPVSLAVDAAGRALLEAGDVVLLGADSVTPAGVSNKVGSWLLAAGAAECGLACYALAGREKWWPTPLPDAGEAARDPREVLAEPVAGLTVRNPYFEPVALERLTAIVTADGPLAPATVLAALDTWSVHPWLLPRDA
jgi:translation initiation factor 2B subunit (eIF-2B alpha/beta/delta family)